MVAKKSLYTTYADILSIICWSLFAILLSVFFYYQVLQGNYYFAKAENNYVRVMPIRAIRGSILDRNGQALAYDRPSFNISLIPYQISSRYDDVIAHISNITGDNVAALEKSYSHNYLNLYSPVTILKDIDKKTALLLKERLSQDLVIDPVPRRLYPNPLPFAHMLGYVKDARLFYDRLKQYGYKPLERVGFLGIEQFYDSYLHGENGGDLIEVDAKGAAVGYIGKRLPQRGNDITLSIDAQLQEIAYQLMEDRPGAFIILDIETGEIQTLVSSPSFDSNAFISGKGTGQYLNSSHSPLLNRTIQSRYPIGSTFKPFLALAALSNKRITAHTPFTCRRVFRVGLTRFHCLDEHGTLDLFNAIAKSCNVYFYNLGQTLGGETISLWAKKFNFDVKTSVDLPYERPGFVPTPAWKRKKFNQSWYPGDTLNLSIGQGYMEVTPLALAVAVASIANGGYLTRPTLLREVGGIAHSAKSRSFLDLDPGHLQTVRVAMRLAVTDESGTAHALSKLPIQIAGKTGTAQTSKKSHGWFVGFFPYAKPRYAIVCLLEHGKSSYFASQVVKNFFNQLTKINHPLLND